LPNVINRSFRSLKNWVGLKFSRYGAAQEAAKVRKANGFTVSLICGGSGSSGVRRQGMFKYFK
jgi:hypothetical protein